MHDAHPAALALMIVSTLVAAACALAAGSAVPWQGRQVAVVMAGGMAALVIPGLPYRCQAPGFPLRKVISTASGSRFPFSEPSLC